MCITSSNARLNATKILSIRKDDGNVYLAYSNTFQNLSGKRNVMLLPIPGEVRSEWFYNTEGYNEYLDDISRHTHVSDDYSYGVLSRGSRTLGISKSVNRVEVGQYEIFFGKDFKELQQRLSAVNVEVSDDLIGFFQTQYPSFTLVACVFDGDKKIDAQPIALEYTPINADLVFFPTMDSHDGSIPRAVDRVKLDHHIIAEDNPEIARLVSFSQAEHVPEWLKNKKFGTYKLSIFDNNGDIYAKERSKANLTRSFANLTSVQ